MAMSLWSRHAEWGNITYACLPGANAGAVLRFSTELVSLSCCGTGAARCIWHLQSLSRPGLHVPREPANTILFNRTSRLRVTVLSLKLPRAVPSHQNCKRKASPCASSPEDAPSGNSLSSDGSGEGTEAASLRSDFAFAHNLKLRKYFHRSL